MHAIEKSDHVRRGEDLELGGHVLVRRREARRLVGGLEEVEHARHGVGRLPPEVLVDQREPTVPNRSIFKILN